MSGQYEKTFLLPNPALHARITEAAAPTTGKQTWPKEMREQVAIVRQMVKASPATADQLAQHFKRKPVAAVQGVLSALEGLGLVTQAGGVYQ